MWQKIQKVSGPIALAFVLIVGLVLVLPRQQAPEAMFSRYDSSEFSCLVYTEPGCSKQVVASGGEIEIASGGTLDVVGTLNNSGGTFTIADAASVTGAFAASSTGSFADKLTMSGETVFATSVITPADASTLTPAATFYTINSAGAVTVTIGTSGATAGQMVFLYGDDANTVTIADTNLRSHDGAALTMGQYDLIGLMFSGTDWIQIIELANQ